MVRQFLALALTALLAICSPAHAVIELDTDENDAIDIVYGGTNAATAGAARTNLGLGALAIYAPTAWRIFYSGAGSALTEMEFGGQYAILQSGGPAAAPTWTATLNFDPLILPNGTNPTVDATGETALDTDGANEASDMTLRVYDGANVVAMGRKLHCIQATIIKPQDLADAVRDMFPLWCNNTGMTYTITEIKGYSPDSTTIALEYVSDTNWSSPSAVDTIAITSAGTSIYTGVTTTDFDDATIAHDQCITIDFHDSEDPDWVKVTVCGWFNAAVD